MCSCDSNYLLILLLFFPFREDLTDYGAEVTSTKTLDPKDNMLDLFEILRARPTTPGKNDDFLRFVKGKKFPKLR